MITTKKTCDRCGTVISDNSDILDTFTGYPFHQYHLCSRCRNAFKGWVAAGPQPDDAGPPEESVPIRLDPRSDAARQRKHR
jgi:hypothetical protein